METASAVTVRVPSALRAYSGGVAELRLAAGSVRAVLEEIERRHPTLHRCLRDETGAVRRHLNIFVNASHVRDREGLETVLVPGDEVTILAAVSGGRTCRIA
ncbi:MAG: MoaD/ThiS family protein [Planctomycetales bacterium]|nr:MoaD/ThiS family protein [Planctomycetales bacterium]